MNSMQQMIENLTKYHKMLLFYVVTLVSCFSFISAQNDSYGCSNYSSRSDCNGSCVWCEWKSTIAINNDSFSFCVEHDLDSNLTILPMCGKNYTCYNTTLIISNKENEADKASLVRRILRDFRKDKSTALRILLDILVITPALFVNTLIVEIVFLVLLLFWSVILSELNLVENIYNSHCGSSHNWCLYVACFAINVSWINYCKNIQNI